jgi:energy-coupling factor transporter transmembrane protein EcfT
MMPIFVAMIISSLKASDQLAKAMESRAFGIQGVQRTALHEIHFQRTDFVLTILILVFFALLLYANFGLGLGQHPLAFFS